MDKENRCEDNFEDSSLKKNCRKACTQAKWFRAFSIKIKEFPVCSHFPNIKIVTGTLLHVYNITKNTTLFSTHSPKSHCYQYKMLFYLFSSLKEYMGICILLFKMWDLILGPYYRISFLKEYTANYSYFRDQDCNHNTPPLKSIHIYAMGSPCLNVWQTWSLTAFW